MPTHFTYKSYAWAIGTTSFRMADFHRKVEEQLILLNEFWNNPDNTNKKWIPETQSKYYQFLLDRNFLTGNLGTDINRQAKTARQKTSGLVDIGLINSERRLTSVGNQLLEIAVSKDFSSDNGFLIPKDSFIYFKQLLKMSKNDWGIVRPFLVLGQLIQECGDYLTDEEFTYLAPLCVNNEITRDIVSKIPECRNNTTSIEALIVKVVLSRYSYPNALKYFVESNATEQDILTIGMNRDGIRHDMCYIPLYKALKNVYLDHRQTSISSLLQAARSINNTQGSLWRKLLFKGNRVVNFNDLKENEFTTIRTETQLKQIFFKYLHLYKIKATLADYKDLNRRYLQNTDTILFSDGKVCFTPLFNSFFKTNAKNVFNEAFVASTANITDNVSLPEIHPDLTFDRQAIITAFNAQNHTNITSIAELYDDLEQKRYEQFKVLIDTKFPNSVILNMLNQFESRQEDRKIIESVGSEADVPTIFEYIVGIIWYRLSEYKGNILDFMKLSLDTNLLPRTHAGGGESDIVYKYNETPNYPEHTLLIECTLMDGTMQRRGEMEPVSRHLGNHILRTGENTYCTFISPYLDINVLTHFRSLKHVGYYDPQNYANHIPSLKVIPIKTNELKTIIQKGIKYKDLYSIMDKAFKNESSIPNWYGNELVANL